MTKNNSSKFSISTYEKNSGIKKSDYKRNLPTEYSKINIISSSSTEKYSPRLQNSRQVKQGLQFHPAHGERETAKSQIQDTSHQSTEMDRQGSSHH